MGIENNLPSEKFCSKIPDISAFKMAAHNDFDIIFFNDTNCLPKDKDVKYRLEPRRPWPGFLVGVFPYPVDMEPGSIPPEMICYDMDLHTLARYRLCQPIYPQRRPSIFHKRACSDERNFHGRRISTQFLRIAICYSQKRKNLYTLYLTIVNNA